VRAEHREKNAHPGRRSCTAAGHAAAKDDEKIRDRPDYVRRRCGEVLRTLYAAQKDVAAYVAISEETGLTAKDCHAIARLVVTKRSPKPLQECVPGR